MDKITSLTEAMITYFAGDPKRIHHFLKVHSLAKTIAIGEGLDKDTLFTLEAAAIVHDIGIKNAEAKFGSAGGKLQEQEGPAPAKSMLESLNFPSDTIERVIYLVGHHHTYKNIDGDDYQILVEADFLVNFYEDNASPTSINSCYTKIFQTQTAKDICRRMYPQAFTK